MAEADPDADSTELCMIDCGISNLRDVPLHSHIQLLNLHSNYISRIDGLQHLKFLKHLDLSANQIRVIEGLDGLVSLRSLNLSCNLLTDLDGLNSLRLLERLDVSYNQIDDLTGLGSLAGASYRLSHLDLHGNKLASVAHVSRCLGRLISLCKLVLSLDGSSNPLCHKSGYQQELLTGLPQLQSLDGRDRLGNIVAESITNIPGLDEYLDQLLSSGGVPDHNTLKDSNMSDVITPKIDQALEMYRRRHVQSSSSANTSIIQSVTDTEVSPASTRVKSRLQDSVEKSEQDARLAQLEHQIAQLLGKAQMGLLPTSSSSDIGDRSSSPTFDTRREPAERDADTEPTSPGRALKKGRQSKLPSYRKSTAASRSRKDIQASKVSHDMKHERRPKSPSVLESGPAPTARVESDDKIRNDIQSSFTDTMAELEHERERRWKAEIAAKKLVEHIQGLSNKAKEDGDMKEIALDATSRLKQALMNEREIKLRLQQQNEELQGQLQEAVEHLSQSKAREQGHVKALREREEIMTREEREKLKQQTHDHKKLQEALMKAAALSREADMLRATCENQKGQVQSLQSLLASREQEHRDELKSRYSLGSPEMQAALQEEVKRSEREHTERTRNQQDNPQTQQNSTPEVVNMRIEELSKQYSGLEDEFRQALQIESSRFQQLKEAFETVSGENASNKSALLAAQQKDEKTAEMVAELTALVKEQKGRISELTKAKQEQSSQYRERVNVLEAHVEEARKRMVQLEILKQDNIKLKSQVHGQESVIEGLRSERKLWGQELAQQGASLAQDRGSLDAKIAQQTSEISMLKKQLERETDGLKIKTKMLEDQTETIRKLKEGLGERDEEIKKCRQENLKMQQNMEEQLTEERTNSQDTHETLERLRERKQDLKHQVSELQAELDESKRAHSVLNSRWKEKSALIGQLEQQVQEMKESWEKKEKKLSHERDKALQAANLAIDRLKSADDSFRKQLEDKVQAFQDQIARLEGEKDTEVEQANIRVYQVEEEMREMLKENQASKKAMEDKVKRLTRAMSELESDLY